MILDVHGNPINAGLEGGSTFKDPGLRGGWSYTDGGEALATTDARMSRDDERKAARVAYMLNPLLFGALNVVVAYVIGDAFSYAEMDDRRAQAALDEFWMRNDLGALTERFFLEYMIDGENATIFHKDSLKLRKQPGRIGFLDVDGTLELDHDTLEGVRSIKSADVRGNPIEWQRGQFVWTAHDALWNRARGWPVIMRAVPACLSYINLINHRIRAHELQGRINAVYYALVDSNARDSGIAEQKAKSEMYKRIPKSGSVITLAMDRNTGTSEKLEFMTPGKGSAEAAEDGRLIRLLVAVAMNLPEHYLGEGGGVTRTTADSMGDPARRGFLRRQMVVRNWLNTVMRLELKRRYGEQQTYKQKFIKVSEDGLSRIVSTRRVPADLLEFPWVFPSVSTDDLDKLVAKVKAADELGLASAQTLSGELSYDPALENERRQQEGKPGLGRSPAAGAKPGVTPPSVDNTQPQDEEPNDEQE
jgi:hypothetical protein